MLLQFSQPTPIPHYPIHGVDQADMNTLSFRSHSLPPKVMEKLKGMEHRASCSMDC